MKFTKTLLAALFCLGCQAAVFAQTSVSLVKTMPAGQTLFSDTVGYKFTVGSKPLKVSALGVAKGNGLNSANQVGLWNESGQLLASATIPLNATLENGFLWQNLSAEVTLAATTTYTVGVCGSDYRYNGALGLQNDVTLLGFVRNNQQGVFSKPSSTVTAGQGAVGANLKYTVQNDPLDSDGDGVNDSREQKDGTDPNNASSFDSLSKGLVAYYPFNGNYKNESGVGADALPKNSVTFVSDQKFGTVVKVQGAGSVGDDGGYIELPEPKLTEKTAFCASFWIKEHGFSYQHGDSYLQAGTGAQSRALLAHLGDWTQQPYYFWTQSTLNQNGHEGKSYQVSAEGIIDKWNQYIITETNGLAKIYRNGLEIYTATTSGAPLGNWHLGRHWWDGGSSQSTRLIASLANLRIYDRALSAAEVSKLYNKESGSSNKQVEFDLGNIVAGGDGQGNVLAGNEGKTGIDTTTGLFTTGMNFGHTYYNAYNSVSKSTFIDGVFNLGANKINSSNVSFNLESGDGSNASFDFITNNREIGGSRAIQFGNKTYSSGIGMSAGSGITFNLNKFREASGAKALTFASDFGTMSGGDWKVRGYAVLSNSTKVLSSEVTPILSSNLAPYQFSISIPEDVDFLTLMVGTGGDGITDDHAGFGNARIGRAGGGDFPNWEIRDDLGRVEDRARLGGK